MTSSTDRADRARTDPDPDPGRTPVRRRTAIAVGVVVLVAVALVVGGFAAWTPITDDLHQQHRETFPDRAAAAAGWVGTEVPAWIPEDATGIRTLATTNESDATIRVDSSSPLPDSCVRAERRNLPALTADWAPAVSPRLETVWRCDEYEVTKVPGGWLGWFHARERGDTPTN